MNQFHVIQPSVLLTPYVRQYWFVTIENMEHHTQRLVPFGYPALCFYREGCTDSSSGNTFSPQSHLFSIATNYIDIAFTGGIDFICIVFQPAGAKAILEIPLNELRNSSVSLDNLGDKQVYTLGQQLNETKDTLKCVRLIEQFLLQRLHYLNVEDKRLDVVINAIRKGETDVNRLAENACLGYKQFKRIFTENIGLNPKKFMQIERFQKLHHFWQQHTEMSLPQLAEECGFYDKSHLIKELKEFSGFTPTELQNACDPVYSDYHALFRSAFVDLPLNKQ